MSEHIQNGWTVKSIALLRRAEQLKKKRLKFERSNTGDVSGKLKRLTKKCNQAEDRWMKLRDDLYEATTERMNARKNSPYSARLQQDIEKLERQAQKERQSVPKLILDFITNICLGVHWGAAFHVVWHNEQYVILRRPGCLGWSGIGLPWHYCKATTAMYDLRKFCSKNDGDSIYRGTTLERHCRVAEVEGRLGAKVLKKWKKTVTLNSEK
jgi:hypothetical protein